MTCLEKLKQDHPNWTDDDIAQIADISCPNDDWGMAVPDPVNCAGGDCGECAECWNREIPGTEPTGTTDAVNHPKHYVREGAMECIDEMLLVFGVEATMCFCLLNAWKYRYRAADKGGEEDLKKSDWYLAVYADLKDGD